MECLVGIREPQVNNPLPDDVSSIWDDIADRNSAALDELMALSCDDNRSLVCTVHEIRNPFANCKSVFC